MIFTSDNKGYSLVELIVVISIITIMTGVLSTGISIMFSKDAEGAAILIDDELTKARMLSMSSPGEFTITIHCDKDGNIDSSKSDYNYIEINNDIASGETGHFSERVYFDTRAYIGAYIYDPSSAEPDYTSRGASEDIEIKFKKSNGSVIEFNGTSILEAKIVKFKCQAVRNQNKISYVDVYTISGRHGLEK